MIKSSAVDSSGRAILPRGGEMEERIASMDWSGTPIGPAELWSPALKTIVRILLANRFPMLLWWGPDYISLYNDAYIPILGQKHPWALGKPVRECWSEIWDVLKPLIDTPFHGGAATWSEDIELDINRAGFTEETHFTIAYSPVPDDAAERGIGGVLATVHEITGKIVGQRRAAALRELAVAVEAKTPEEACWNAVHKLAPHRKDLPFALIYLRGEDGEDEGVKLAASIGIRNVSAIPPSFWPLEDAQASGRMRTVDLPAGFAVTPEGPWPEPPNRAAVLPLRSHVSHRLSGFLVAGLSSALRLDESYVDFLKLATSQIATAISTALAYELERKRADALAEVDRAKTTFFSNVSHEFRTPLTLMLGPLEEVLAEGEQLGPANREKLSIAHRNSLRLLKLVNSLLDFSRIEAGRMQASFAPVDLAVATRDLASNFRSAMEAAGLEFEVRCEPLPEPVYVDLEMWEKIVLNLLSNAFKYTLEGKVTLTLEADGRRAVLTVSDTGVGIPERDIPHIFERFHRVEGSRGRSYEGTGIGLALVQELAHLHGGGVRVESAPGKGTTFFVEIPFGREHLPADRVTKAPTSGATRAHAYVEAALGGLPGRNGEVGAGDRHPAEAPGERSPRILVAEDNADMRQYIVRLLGERMHVATVENGREAFASALADPPDLILSDVMMPAMEGFGLLAELRAHSATSSIPVILLSARAGEEARIDGVTAGADDYLVKPFSAAELMARVTGQLKLARTRQESMAKMRRLQEMSTRLTGESDLATLLGEFLDAAIEITRADMGNVQLLDPATGELTIAAQRGLGAPFLDFFQTTKGRAAACGAAMREGRRIVVEDVAESPDFDPRSRETLLAAGVRAVQATPFVSRSGRLLGVLSTHFRTPGRPRDRDLQLLDVLARQAADLIETNVSAEALRASQQRLTLAMEAAGMGAWEVDLATGRSRWSRRHFEILGYPPDPDREMSVEMWRSRLHPEDVEGVDAAIEKARVQGAQYASEHRIRRADTGEVRWLAEFGRYVGGRDGEPHRFVGVSLDITERVQAAQSALLLGAIVDSSHDAIISKDLDGVITSWNKGAESLFGYTAAEAIGKTVADLLIPADRQDEEPQILARLRRGERVDHFETVRRRKDGSLLDISLTVSPVKDDRGRVTGASKIARDITDRKRAEEQLRKSEERFRALVTASSDVVYQMNSDWSEMRLLVGREFVADTLEPSRSWSERYIPSDDRERVTRAIAEAIRGKSMFSLEHRVIRADETPGWALSRAVPILNQAGEIVEWFGAASDITGLKTAEEALRQSEERFRQLTEVGPQMMWLSGPRGELDFVNRRWIEYSGLDLKATRDRARLEQHLDPEDRVTEHWARALASETPFELEARLRGSDGEFRWFMMRSVPVRDQHGRVQRWFGSATDIHGSKLLQLELWRANQDLEQFAYSASHDLREPLRGVKIFSELVAMRYRDKLDAQGVEFLENVRDGATRMEMLVNDLLSYTQSGKFDHPDTPVDANEAFRAALANLAGAIAESGGVVECDPLPCVRAPATQLQQLFQNLIGNAVKYHRPGVPPVVKTTVRREGGCWVFSVRDNGIGIAPEFQERVFGLFKRLHTRDEYSGTGIGLAICQRIVERHHGRIWVESTLGEGSTFSFALPA